MLLSHYEILACGTALWKLLDLTVFAQGLLINSPLNDGVCPKQTAHVTDERERETESERKVDWTRAAGYHSSITIYRGSIPSLLVRRQTLSPSPSGWMVPPRHTILLLPFTVPCCTSTSFLSSHTSFLPTATSSTPAVSASSFSQPTFLTWFTGLYHSTPSGSNGL